MVDQRCLRNSRGALVETRRCVVPKKEHKRSHFVHKLAVDRGEMELAVFFANSPDVRVSHELSLHSDTLTNTTVSSVGLGPDPLIGSLGCIQVTTSCK